MADKGKKTLPPTLPKVNTTPPGRVAYNEEASSGELLAVTRNVYHTGYYRKAGTLSICVLLNGNSYSH